MGSIPLWPFNGSTKHHIVIVLTKHNIQMAGWPPQTIFNFLHPVKDDMALILQLFLWVLYSIHWTNVLHHWDLYQRMLMHITLYNPEKLAVEKHIINLNCHILYNTKILTKNQDSWTALPRNKLRIDFRSNTKMGKMASVHDKCSTMAGSVLPDH
jgi:hypothetical protein